MVAPFEGERRCNTQIIQPLLCPRRNVNSTRGDRLPPRQEVVTNTITTTLLIRTILGIVQLCSNALSGSAWYSPFLFSSMPSCFNQYCTIMRQAFLVPSGSCPSWQVLCTGMG